jgi:uncharacterized NAD(P)/FAD-binding protein YdhS
VESFIQVKDFSDGREKRRWKRKEMRLDMVYFFQDKSYKAKIENISYGGLLFTAETFIPIEKTIYTNIACNILQENVTIGAVLQVLRVEKKEETPFSADPKEIISQKYSIAGFFSFITEEDRKKLAMLLR